MSTLCGAMRGKNGFKDGDGRDALFNFPYGIAILDNNTLLLTESDNHSLRKISLTSDNNDPFRIS